MHVLKTLALCIVLICTFSIKGITQGTTPVDSVLLVIPPLPYVINAALHYSPMLRVQSASIEAAGRK
jgi:hypothetical protein